MSALKQLTIKSNSCNRLAKDLVSYADEHKKLQQNIDLLRKAAADEHEIRKQQEFIDENERTTKDIRSRLSAATRELQTSLNQSLSDADLASSKEVVAAQKTLADMQRVLSDATNLRGQTDSKDAKDAKDSKDRPVRVGVFGSSRCDKGDEVYKVAEAIGQALSANGYHIVCGGYGGTMEAVCEGGSKTKAYFAEGLTCPTAFPHRGAEGNKFLTVVTKAESLHQRLQFFCDHCDIFVVLPGNIGTLTELVLTWSLSAIDLNYRQKALSSATAPTLHLGRPILAMVKPWKRVCETLSDQIGISPEDMSLVQYFDGVDDLLAKIKTALGTTKKK